MSNGLISFPKISEITSALDKKIAGILKGIFMVFFYKFLSNFIEYCSSLTFKSHFLNNMSSLDILIFLCSFE